MPRALALLMLAVLLVGGCQPARTAPGTKPQAFHWQGQTMGTSFLIRGVAPAGRVADQAWRQQLEQGVAALLRDFDARFSTYNPGSEISRFNAWAQTTPFACSAELVALCRQALAVAEATKGAFDPTLLPLLRLHGMGPGAPEVAALPTPAQRDAVAAYVGWQKLEPGTGQLRKRHPKLQLDLNALAKGAGVDRVLEWLRPQLDAAMVEIGGEVRCFGRKPDGTVWVLGVEDPAALRAGRQEILERVELLDRAMATSGTYRQFQRLGGRRIPHIIDGRPGSLAPSGVVSVTVLAPDCATADAWATALQVLGPIAGEAAMRRAGLQLPALFLLDAGGKLRIHRQGW